METFTRQGDKTKSRIALAHSQRTPSLCVNSFTASVSVAVASVTASPQVADFFLPALAATALALAATPATAPAQGQPFELSMSHQRECASRHRLEQAGKACKEVSEAEADPQREPADARASPDQAMAAKGEGGKRYGATGAPGHLPPLVASGSNLS